MEGIISLQALHPFCPPLDPLQIGAERRDAQTLSISASLTEGIVIKHLGDEIHWDSMLPVQVAWRSMNMQAMKVGECRLAK
jgi:hypothetical protein